MIEYKDEDVNIGNLIIDVDFDKYLNLTTSCSFKNKKIKVYVVYCFYGKLIYHFDFRSYRNTIIKVK